MQRGATFADVVLDILAFLAGRTRIAVAAGVDPRAIAIDPGLGFGKKPEHNTEILRRLGELRPLGFPILVGASRKSFVGAFGGGDAGDRTEASLGAAVLAVEHGADILRVHDVSATAKAIRAADAVVRGKP